jgi:hypothetical protein
MFHMAGRGFNPDAAEVLGLRDCIRTRLLAAGLYRLCTECVSRARRKKRFSGDSLHGGWCAARWSDPGRLTGTSPRTAVTNFNGETDEHG